MDGNPRTVCPGEVNLLDFSEKFCMQGTLANQVNWPRLRGRVHADLNRLGDFEPGAFQITERWVHVAGEPCGVHYCLHGPRNVKLTAVVDLKKQQLLFYGTDGQRLEQQPLSEF